MSAQDVQSEILEPMQRLYLPPRNMDEGQQSQALREYVSALQNFEQADLNAAWCAVRDTHTTRSWPVPAAFIIAAKQARKYRNEAGLGRNDAAAVSPENDSWEVWKKICRSQMGRDAVQRGVAWALKCAVLHDKKKPEQIDLRELVSGKASAERTAAGIENGSVPMRAAYTSMALNMWHTLQMRETETQAEINYGSATAPSYQ
jgi:hypothetical protein